MITLYDRFKFNNVPYSELTDNAGKKEIERWVNKLKETDLQYLLLQFEGACINIQIFPPRSIDEPKVFVNNIPEDLMAKIVKTVDG
jgi:hypothetical protein